MTRLVEVNSLQEIGNSLNTIFKKTTSYLLFTRRSFSGGGPPDNFSMGLSSLTLLFIIALGVLIMWEANEYIYNYALLGKGQAQNETAQSQEPICRTGEADNCNDSNDVFILN